MTISPRLDPLLAAMAVEVEAFALCGIGADTCLATPRVAAVEIHHVLAGTLHFAIEDERPVALGPGAVVIVPAGLRQRLSASATPAREVAAETVCAARPDGILSFDVGDWGPATVRVACGKLRATIGGHDILAGVVAPIVVDLADSAFVREAFATMVHESAAPGPGTRALLGALMKACFVLVLRYHLAHGDLPGLLGRAPLGRAMADVLGDPARPHRLVDLARSAGMSRSAFARAFAADVGVPPMAFVAQTRLARARDLLDGGGLTVGEVAVRVGFASRSAFSRSFRRRYGVDPKRFRDRISKDVADVR
jgi:AraC family transcriptional activator of mtrCDE